MATIRPPFLVHAVYVPLDLSSSRTEHFKCLFMAETGGRGMDGGQLSGHNYLKKTVIIVREPSGL